MPCSPCMLRGTCRDVRRTRPWHLQLAPFARNRAQRRSMPRKGLSFALCQHQCANSSAHGRTSCTFCPWSQATEKRHGTGGLHPRHDYQTLSCHMITRSGGIVCLMFLSSLSPFSHFFCSSALPEAVSACSRGGLYEFIPGIYSGGTGHSWGPCLSCGGAACAREILVSCFRSDRHCDGHVSSVCQNEKA